MVIIIILYYARDWNSRNIDLDIVKWYHMLTDIGEFVCELQIWVQEKLIRWK